MKWGKMIDGVGAKVTVSRYRMRRINVWNRKESLVDSSVAGVGSVVGSGGTSLDGSDELGSLISSVADELGSLVGNGGTGSRVGSAGTW